MLINIVKVANKLDSLGLIKEADFLDQLIKKNASDDYENLWSRQEALQGIDKPPPVSENDLRNAILENLKKQIRSDSVEITDMVWGKYHESVTSDMYCWRVTFNLRGMSVETTVPVARVTRDFDDDSISVTGTDEKIYYFFAFLE